MTTTLIVGATGKLGSRIARELLSARRPVRALCRPGSPDGMLRRWGATIAPGDLRRPESLAEACRDVDTVIAAASAARRMGDDTIDSVDRQGTSDLVDAAARAGVRRFVYISALQADEQSPAPLMAARGMNETRLRASGLEWTVIAPDLGMENWIAPLVGVPAVSGRPVVLVGDGQTRHAFIADHDVAAFTVAVVASDGASRRRLEIGGPRRWSWREVVALYESALGRAIEVHCVLPVDVAGPPAGVAQPLLSSIDVFEREIDVRAPAIEFGVSQSTLEAWVRASLATMRPRMP